MIFLLLTLAAIALFDSISMVPLAAIPLTMALGGKRPWASAGAFVGGIYVTYFICGAVLLMGTEFIFENFGAYFDRLWNQPNALELVAQILIGLLLIVSAWYLRRPAKAGAEARPAPEASTGAMFLLGATLVLLGIPGAVPYLAAIERIVRFDPDWVGAIGCLVFYNLLFVFPFLCLMGLRFLMPHHAGRFFQSIADFALKVMPWLAAVLFFLAGLVMVADGIGWFLGHPVLPVSSPTGSTGFFWPDGFPTWTAER